MPGPDDPLQTFHPWSLSHWGAIVGAIVIAAGLAGLRRRWRGVHAGRRLDLTLATLSAANWIATQLLQWSSDQFPGRTSLPLHVSDLAGLAVPLALWTCWRWVRCVVYYWGLALGSLAFLLPDLYDGPARLGYWLFWLTHMVILLGVAYETIGRDYRPGWRDFGRAACASLLYALLIVPFNAATGFSYGYLGPPHGAEPAILGYFGPWPLRVVPIVLTGLAGMALLTLPWQFGAGRRAHGAADRARRSCVGED
jgi:hypothetical integral membrane protein (TIGR02206 family)